MIRSLSILGKMLGKFLSQFMPGEKIEGNQMIAVVMVEVVLIHIDMIGTLGMITTDLSAMSTTDIMRGMELDRAGTQEVTIEEETMNIAGREMIQTDIPVGNTQTPGRRIKRRIM